MPGHRSPCFSRLFPPMIHPRSVVSLLPSLLLSPVCQVYSGETPGGPKFVRYLNNDPSLIPSIGNCFALFFLHNESAFLHAWYDWLCPGLVVRGYPVRFTLILPGFSLLTSVFLGCYSLEPNQAVSGGQKVPLRSENRLEHPQSNSSSHCG